MGGCKITVRAGILITFGIQIAGVCSVSPVVFGFPMVDRMAAILFYFPMVQTIEKQNLLRKWSILAKSLAFQRCGPVEKQNKMFLDHWKIEL